MIILSNGHKFKFMTASGALAYDGGGWPWEKPLRWMGLIDPTLFTNVTKTLTLSPREGNLRWSHPWSVVKKIPAGGVVNAIGLTNPGIHWWLEFVGPYVKEERHLIVSIEARDVIEVAEMIQLLEGQNIKGIELNFSCPNTPDHEDRTTEKIVSIGRKAAKLSHLPLIAKLSFTQDYVAIARELSHEKRIEAFSINSVPWAMVFPNRPSPLAAYGGGGVSGRRVQDFTWEMVEELAIATSVPVIGPSVWEYDDIQRVTDKGAKAVSFGSIFVHHPTRPTKFVRRWIAEHVKPVPAPQAPR